MFRRRSEIKVGNRCIQFKILYHRVATNELLFKIKDKSNYCNTGTDMLCHALIECPISALLWNMLKNVSVMLQVDISKWQITKEFSESIMI